MIIWPKCAVCQTEIVAKEPFVVVECDPLARVITVAHDRCVKEPKHVRRMNDVRAWAVREYSTVRESVSASTIDAQIPTLEATNGT